MSSKHRGGAGALVALAAIGAPVPTVGELPPVDGPDPGPDAGANAEATFVESDVVAENHVLKTEVERLTRELGDASAEAAQMRAERNASHDAHDASDARHRTALADLRDAHQRALDEQRVDFDRLMREQNARFDREWDRRELALGGAPAPRTRLVFDASVPGLDADGNRVIFVPGDPVPGHINPDTLPAHAVRRVEEG